ncbi:MAG: efflux RND transporter periplasmic adaptor subunit [bacterium]
MSHPHPFLAATAVAISLLAAGCGRNHRESTPAPAGTPLPAGAEIVTARIEQVATRIDIIGTTYSTRQINLSARISSYVKDVFASAGNRVQKDQVLLTLDDREILEQLAQADAQMMQASTEYNRTKQLFEKNVASEQELTAAESAYNGARAQVDRIKVTLSYTQVLAPIDGVVTERRIEAGDLAGPGQVLLAVYDPAQMRLEVPVPLRLVAKLALNQPVDVVLDHPARTLQGEVTEIVSEIDPRSRTQKVKVRLSDDTGDILPGTFGRLWVEDAPHAAILVPASAICRAGQVEMVQAVEAGHIIRRLVKSGPAYGDRVEILSGLRDGDQIVVNPDREG